MSFALPAWREERRTESAVGLVIRPLVRGECSSRVAGQAGGSLWLRNDAVREGDGVSTALAKITCEVRKRVHWVDELSKAFYC